MSDKKDKKPLKKATAKSKAVPKPKAESKPKPKPKPKVEAKVTPAKNKKELVAAHRIALKKLSRNDSYASAKAKLTSQLSKDVAALRANK